MGRHSGRMNKRKREDKPSPNPKQRDRKLGNKRDVRASSTTMAAEKYMNKNNKTEEALSEFFKYTPKPSTGFLFSPESNAQKPKGRVIFILDNALLIKGLVNKKLKILNSDEVKHADFLLKHKKNLNDYKPNIVYQALRGIFDSPLCKAGMVRAVYVKIYQGVLFEIKPNVRIPRSLDRFCGIMLDLLKESCIRDKQTGEVLIRVINEPVTRHLPVNSRIVGLSCSSEKLVDLDDYVSSATDDLNHVFVVGTMGHDKINKDYTDDFISISNCPLNATCSIGMIASALENKWKICSVLEQKEKIV